MTVDFSFSRAILRWYDSNKRDLPWRSSSNPYSIWLSEVILQQTRVEQGLPYYQKFIHKFPTVQAMAKATENEILKLWQGLGYYSRGRNMLHTAQYITRELNGQFPSSATELKKLKGIGDYTSKAIASFSFDEKVAVVDGNVYRVLSRFFGIDTPIDSSQGQKEFQILADQLLPKSNSQDYNQGIMEFGAIQCKPKPDCHNCPIKARCIAFQNNTVGSFPVKSKKTTRKHRYLNYLFLYHGEKMILEKRSEKDIWRNMFQFPLIESDSKFLEADQLLRNFKLQNDDVKILHMDDPHTFQHHLSHRILHLRIWPIHIEPIAKSSTKSDIFEISFEEQRAEYAVPVVLQNFIIQFKKEIVSK